MKKIKLLTLLTAFTLFFNSWAGVREVTKGVGTRGTGVGTRGSSLTHEEIDFHKKKDLLFFLQVYLSRQQNAFRSNPGELYRSDTARWICFHAEQLLEAAEKEKKLRSYVDGECVESDTPAESMEHVFLNSNQMTYIYTPRRNAAVALACFLKEQGLSFEFEDIWAELEHGFSSTVM